MSFKDVLGKIFPRPHLQKRYILGLGAAIYFGLKVYVNLTPSPADNLILEQAVDIAMQILAESDSVGAPVEVAIPEPSL